MTIIHLKRKPPTYNAIQYDGSNVDDIQAALNPSIFLVTQNYFNQRLLVRDRISNTQVLSIIPGNWIISAAYNGVETDQFGTTLETLTDDDFQLQFIIPEPPVVEEPPVEDLPPVDPQTPTE